MLTFSASISQDIAEALDFPSASMDEPFAQARQFFLGKVRHGIMPFAGALPLTPFLTSAYF